MIHYHLNEQGSFDPGYNNYSKHYQLVNISRPLKTIYHGKYLIYFSYLNPSPLLQLRAYCKPYGYVTDLSNFIIFTLSPLTKRQPFHRHVLFRYGISSIRMIPLSGYHSPTRKRQIPKVSYSWHYIGQHHLRSNKPEVE